MGFPPPPPARPRRDDSFIIPYAHKRQYGFSGQDITGFFPAGSSRDAAQFIARLGQVGRVPWYENPEALADFVRDGYLTIDEAEEEAAHHGVLHELGRILFSRQVYPPPVPYLTYDMVMIDEGYEAGER